MRENRTSGLMRGSNGNGDSRPLLSTLLVVKKRGLVDLTCRLTTSVYDAGLFVVLTINYRRHDAAG